MDLVNVSVVVRGGECDGGSDTVFFGRVNDEPPCVDVSTNVPLFVFPALCELCSERVRAWVGDADLPGVTDLVGDGDSDFEMVDVSEEDTRDEEVDTVTFWDKDGVLDDCDDDCDVDVVLVWLPRAAAVSEPNVTHNNMRANTKPKHRRREGRLNMYNAIFEVSRVFV